MINMKKKHMIRKKNLVRRYNNGKKSLKELMTTIDYSIKQGGLRNGIPIDKGCCFNRNKKY